MNFWALALLLLVFISKLSLAAVGVPAQLSGVLFQHGLHPYLNVVLSFMFGLPLTFLIVRYRHMLNQLLPTYRSLLVILIGMLFLETLLQYLFLGGTHGVYSWAAFISTFWLILLFGVVLPVTVAPAAALRFISTWALNFVVLSLVLWLLRPDLSFKGGRFVGIFKHIPYMVTCASVGVIFTLGRFHQEKKSLWRLWYALGVLLSFFALLLTGTRSALAAVVMAFVLWVLRTPTHSIGFRYFKYSTAATITTVALLFGGVMLDYAKDIATGKKSLVDRQAQDGIASRLEEVERGWEYFQSSPWIGQGLLSKFSSKESLEVSSYNSFKDPHNIFVSAGVVGGWFFIFWTAVFVLLLLVLSFQALLSVNTVLQIFGIYGIVQIPILIIYHWHLSLGGMADRFYWLVFGYLALRSGLRGPLEKPR